MPPAPRPSDPRSLTPPSQAEAEATAAASANAIAGSGPAMDEGPRSDFRAAAWARRRAQTELRATIRTWHAGWALGQVGLAGILLLSAQGPAEAARRGAMALGVAAIPGLIGALRPPRAPDAAAPLSLSGRWVLLILWTICAAAAVTISGGAAGPLAIYALAPALAAVVLRAPWSWAAGLAAFATAFATAARFGQVPPPGDPAGAAILAGGSMVVTAVAAVSLLAARRAAPAASSSANGRSAPPLRPALLTEAPAISADGAANGDLARRLRAAEAGRAEAEAEAASRARFLANMSHELRTPLNAIMGFSDIMRTRLFGPLPDRYAEYAEMIHESGRHLVDLINDVLDLSKIDAERYELHREVFDVREAVNAAMRLLRVQADEAGIHLWGLLPDQPLMVDADRRAIKQIVLNLVSNALKFTQKGGEAVVALNALDDAVELAVTDTGVGIAPEDLARLGRPFEQADAGRRVRGTGLGLSLVRAFARLHGGEMTVESRLGEGTAVTVTLPVLHKPPVGAPTAAAPATPAFAAPVAE